MVLRHALIGLVLMPLGALAQSPQNLNATAGDREVTLAWEAPNIEQGDTLACYRVYRDTTTIPDDPSDQTALRVAEVTPSEQGSPSYTDPGLSNGTTYFFRVTAETGETGDGTVSCGGPNADESSFSNEASATPFAPTVLQITDPDVPTSQPVDAGTAVDVTVQGTNVPPEETVRLQYRQGGEDTFTTLTMARDGTEFTASVLGEDVTARGIEYVVTTRNEGGEVVREPSDGVASVRVTSETLSFSQPGGTAQTAYRIVSYPGELKDPRLSNLFGRFAPYDPTEWRLFAIGTGGVSSGGGYAEQDDLGQELEVGQGLWLISRSGGTLGPVSGTSLRTDEPFEIPLREGWNLIGNPFAFEVSVAQLRVTNSAGSLRGGDLFGYDGTFVPKIGGPVSDSTLKPYRGYLVRLSDGQAGTLVIDPSTSAASPSSPVGRARGQWQATVSARVGRSRDAFNAFGVASGAGEGIDPVDGREPPPVGDYVSLAFQPPAREESLWRDFRAPGRALHTWTADVRTNVDGTATLRVRGIDAVPEEQAVWLVDPALDVSQNLREDPHYQFPSSPDETARHIQFLVGTPAAVQQALDEKVARSERVRLYPSAPNPVRDQATLRYAVPSPARVTLELYDLLGRKVATLVENRAVEAGPHAYVWTPGSQGGGVSSGTYLLRLRAGDTTRTRRLVVMR